MIARHRLPHSSSADPPVSCRPTPKRIGATDRTAAWGEGMSGSHHVPRKENIIIATDWPRRKHICLK